MKKKPVSRSAFFNPRVLINFAFCAFGVLLALGVAFSASSEAPLTVTALSSNTNAGPSLAVPVASSALVETPDNGPVQIEKIREPNGLLALLYDQTDNPSAVSTSSQNFEPANDTFDAQAADDFVVPPGSAWTVQQLFIPGAYFNGNPPPGGPAVSVNVTFYVDAGTLPGAAVAGGTYTATPIATDVGGDFTINLTPNLLLPAGTYWVSVQANMNYVPTGQWGWTDRTIASNSGAAWRNPGGGFAGGCTSYTRKIICIPEAEPDQLFQILGTSTGGPSPTPTPTPSPGACAWTAAAAYPIPILDEAVTSVGSNVYSFGGVSGAIVNNSYKFDGTTWTAIAPLPVALAYPAAVNDGTNIYLVGGINPAGTPVNTLYKYDPVANTYTTLAPFVTGTWNHAAVYLNGKIFKFTGTGPATASTNVLEIYDVGTNTWSAGANYPLAISFVSAFAQGNFIYAAGGIQTVGVVASANTYRYDPGTNTWDDLAIADLPATRWGAATAFFNGGAVLAGGYVAGSTTTNISNTAISWDLASDTWSSLANMLGERSRMNGAVLNGSFYVVGGRSMASASFAGTNDNQKLSCGIGPSPTPSGTPSPTAAPTCTPLAEGFDDITTLVPGGWNLQNHSTTIGTSGWFQGNPAVFPSQSGAANSYIAANFNNTTGTNTISNWLLTPPLTLQNGNTITFYTRTVDTRQFPDRLQVRMSVSGASTNVGTTATEVGDFTALLLDINPTYTLTGYPNAWTQFTVTVSGIASPTTGRLAFRYFVEEGGPTGVRSDYIGIDTVQYSCITPTPTPAPIPTPTPTPTPTPAPAAQALNLSARLRVGIGDGVGIGGIIITGSAPKPVIIRAIGPSLTRFGLIDVLADPVLELHGPGGFATILSDNWQDNAAQAAAIRATGLAPVNDFESAIFATLNPGAYTAIVSGKNNTSGIALVEFYDLNQTVPSRLANLSTRAFVATDESIFIAGLMLGPNNAGAGQVIVRGIGPSLTAVGVPTVLADPVLELRNSDGTLLRSNNDWQDNAAQRAEISAAGLAPSNNLEAAIAATLPPGLYTALLAGLNNGTGIGLVEVYDRGATGVLPTPSPGGTVTPTPTPTPPNPLTTPTPTPTPTTTPTATPTATPTPTPTATVSPTPGLSCTEDFDGVTAPALPRDWVQTPVIRSSDIKWVTSTASPQSGPNHAFIPDDQTGRSDNVLDSRPIMITSPAAVLSFQNNYNTEVLDGLLLDGGVLEVSTDGGVTYNDIITAGGMFVPGPGGYVGQISTCCNNPLGGRSAWAGNSNGYITTSVNLPAGFNGQTIKLRFRMGTDIQPEIVTTTQFPGWLVDNIQITGASCP